MPRALRERGPAGVEPASPGTTGRSTRLSYGPPAPPTARSIACKRSSARGSPLRGERYRACAVHSPRSRQTSGVARIPKWAQWQIDNPPPGISPRGVEINRRFWTFVAWEARFWLACAALLVVFALVLLVVVVAGAL